MNWLKTLIASNISIDSSKYEQKLRQYLTDLSDKSYTSKYRTPGNEYTMDDAEQDIARVLSQTQNNMQQLLQTISAATGKINWQGSPILIQVGSPPTESSFFGPNYLEAVTDAQIYIGGLNGPEFTLFNNEGKFEIDDVLDADEDDFFPSPVLKQDYYNLVRELKNPGSGRSNKIITLYTARPIADRALYEGSFQIPANIFLTNNYNHAEGYAIDLNGRSIMRDIWKVTIEEQYLNMTLNNGYIREYQTIGNGFVPVKGIRLVSPGS